MSIHISNKLFSSRSLMIICITAVLVGFIFVNLLIFYFPRDNRIDLNGLTSISIQSISKETKNQVATADPSIYNIAKAIAKDGILVTYTAPDKLNQDYERNSNIFAEILNSRAFITGGQDDWLESKKTELTKLEILDLSKVVKLKSKIPAIDLGTGNEQDSLIDQSAQNIDYSYLLDQSNLKVVIESIADLLVKLDPNNKDQYIKNQIELDTKITNIDNQYSQILTCNQQPIIASAKNLGYIASKYNIELSVVSSFDPLAPTPNQIKYLQNFAKSKNTNNFFVDKKIPLIDYTNFKDNLGLDIYYISDYIYPDIADTLQKNLENLKKSQGCD